MPSLQTIDTMFSQAVESKKMPGIVAVAATDKGRIYEGAFGTREMGASAPMTLDTVVWIASMTKAITATAAMQLVEGGKLSLDRPAQEVVPELARARVLEGFDGAGQPRLRAPKRPITL
jgi:CubicO group peptidase (beta-lactamase class C family)